MEQFSEFFENLAFMTFSHDRFWVLCAIIVAVILVYQLLLRFAPKTVGPVHHFLQRHPLIWICIPAALLIPAAALAAVLIRRRAGKHN